MTERRRFFHLTRKECLILGSAYLVIFLLVLAVFQLLNVKPKDAALAQQFYANRETFEEIKKMLELDAHLGVIAEYGVRPTNAPFGASPPEEFGLARERYEKYLRLLKKAGAFTVVRSEGEFRFFVAASGFASKGIELRFFIEKAYRRS